MVESEREELFGRPGNDGFFTEHTDGALEQTRMVCHVADERLLIFIIR